ncbi:outer membrane beta-barrel protein [Vibrio maritimus]|uniref:outer membrane beta-barrel protein n=1 Tax=Vibrio maritimus TaxID=990268 RepID=UPI003736DB2E
MNKSLIALSLLFSAGIQAAETGLNGDQFSGLHVELLKTGYTAKSDLEGGAKVQPLMGWGLQAGYELNGMHDFVASISRQDGDLNDGTHTNVRLGGNAYKLAWNSGYTFNVLPKVLSIKPYGILGWTWLDGSANGGGETFSDKESSYTYGIGVKANVFEDFTLGAEWSRGEFYSSDMDTITLMAGLKF